MNFENFWKIISLVQILFVKIGIDVDDTKSTNQATQSRSWSFKYFNKGIPSCHLLSNVQVPIIYFIIRTSTWYLNIIQDTSLTLWQNSKWDIVWYNLKTVWKYHIKRYQQIRDRSLFYDQGGSESNDFWRDIFFWPTTHAEKNIW